MGELVDVREVNRQLSSTADTLQHRCDVELSQRIITLTTSNAELTQRTKDQQAELTDMRSTNAALAQSLDTSEARIKALVAEADAARHNLHEV